MYINTFLPAQTEQRTKPELSRVEPNLEPGSDPSQDEP